jgi:hypothetical protein
VDKRYKKGGKFMAVKKPAKKKKAAKQFRGVQRRNRADQRHALDAHCGWLHLRCGRFPVMVTDKTEGLKRLRPAEDPYIWVAAFRYRSSPQLGSLNGFNERTKTHEKLRQDIISRGGVGVGSCGHRSLRWQHGFSR